MLILRRKSGESIVIGEDIYVTVLDINEGSVRLAIDAPKAIPILRSELLQAADANRDSAVTEQEQSRNLLRFLGGKSGPEQSRPRAVRPGAANRAFLAAHASFANPTDSAQTSRPVAPMETARTGETPQPPRTEDAVTLEPAEISRSAEADTAQAPNPAEPAGPAT